MNQTIVVKRWAAWEPPADNPAAAPALEWMPPLFRRRQSQISRMTCEGLRRLAAAEGGGSVAGAGGFAAAKIVFVSMRGELNRQFDINKMLIEDAALTPAAFSQSVFNTPAALATIALGHKAGYSCLYPAKFYDGFVAALAPLLAGLAHEVIFAYADEYPRPEYRPLVPSAEAACKNLDSLHSKLSKQKWHGGHFCVLFAALPPNAGTQQPALSLPCDQAGAPQTFLHHLRTALPMLEAGAPAAPGGAP